jgi:hypothetical protein
VKLRVLFWLFLIVSISAFSQSLQPDQLMLLVIARSAARPDADAKTLLERVQALRNSPGLNQLKVATMHFDRPREASFARQVLGVTDQQLPCVCLVQLDGARLRPTRSLYCWPNVTGAKLAQVDQMAETWAQMASQPLALFTPQPLPPTPGLIPPVMAVNPAAVELPRPQIPELYGAKDRVFAGVNMVHNSWLRSPNGVFACCFQDDGNLVVYNISTRPFQSLWNSQTQGRGASAARLGSDGVLRIMGTGGQVLWQVGDASYFSHCFLQMQDDGNLVIYRQDGNGLTVDWASNTVRMRP